MRRVPLKIHEGVAAPMLINNVDTDQIIPSREMKTVSRAGLAEGLFAGWRYKTPAGREENPDFILNRPEYRDATILLTGKNFGCGSSREHAVWALAEYGVRVIIASSFGEIFFGNCARNGILPIILPSFEVQKISDWVTESPQRHKLKIDLEKQQISYGSGPNLAIDMDPYHKKLLTGGRDPIGLTLEYKPMIEKYFERDKTKRPWIYEI